MKILSFGEIIWDVFPDDKYIGGATFNFSANLSYEGADSYIMTAVGNDNLGQDAISKIEEYNVKTDFINIINDKETGQCIVHFDEIIGPSYTIKDDVAYDYITYKDSIENKQFDALSYGSLALRHKNNFNLLNKLINSNNFNLLFCDINLRAPYYNEEVIEFCFSTANILKINDLEFKELIGNINDDLENVLLKFVNKHKNIDIVLLTCGDKGAYAYESKNKKLYYQKAIKVEVVSTVGAGDSFGACFLYNYLENKSIEECLLKAAHRSAKIVSQMQAI